MKPALWLRIVLWVALLSVLAGCNPLPSKPVPATPLTLSGGTEIGDVGSLPVYRLSLALDPAKRRLEGRQAVTYSNHSGVELSEIVFRLYPNLPQYGGQMSIGPVWVDGQRATSLLRAENTSLVVPLPKPLAPEASVTISTTFDIEIPQRDSGYVLFGHSQGFWSLPDSYPLLAVYDGSRWHEDLAPAYGDAVFAEAAFYEVALTLPPDLILATTGSVISDTQTSGNGRSDSEGQRVYQVVGGPLREFAWVANASYLVSEAVAEGATVRAYYLPGDESAGQAALSTAAAALRAYGDEFGPYPFDEMDVAESPLLFYGMEFPGLNLIGEALYRDQRSELEDRIAHEIAHQWWYSQVGNDQINIPWLDEGLAEYSMVVYYRAVYGEARANRLVNQRWLVPYQVAVENGLDAVVNQPAAAFGQEYEVIVYGKAALFFDALRHELGDETFRAVLREYLKRYQWRIATPDGFLGVAESVSGQDLDGLYNHWILSKQ
jgi:hypothetical protein